MSWLAGIKLALSGSHGEFQGKQFPAGIELSGLDGLTGFPTGREGPGALVGPSVASGDVNGDGYSDVILGAPFKDPGGSTYVVFGKASGFAADLALSALDGSNGFRIDGESSDDVFGWSVASGDVNGDGF